MRNKKAMEMMWPIIVMIVGLVFMIALLLFYKMTTDVGSEASAVQACRASVLANSRFGTEINCPVEFIKIKTKNHETAKKQVADAMVRCWDNYGKGKLKLFAAEDTKFCAVCSTIQFKKIDENIEGFGYYLATKSFRKGNKLFNYQEYLSGHKTSEEVIDKLSQNRAVDYLDPKQGHALLFVFYKDSDWTKIGAIVVGVYVGVMVIGTVAATTVVTGGAAIPFWVIGAGAVAAGAAGGIVAGEAHAAAGSAIGAEWSANIIITHLNAEALRKLGCEKLPVGITGLDTTKTSDIQPEVRR